VLYFGAPTDELIAAGLPVIAVYPLWGQWMPPFNAYKGKKVITSCLPVIYDKALLFTQEQKNVKKEDNEKYM